MREITIDQIKHLIRIFKENDIDATPRSYYGRGMYGRECFGIDTSSDIFTLGLVIGMMAGQDDTIPQMFIGENVDTDSMGLGTIVYWKHLKWPVVDGKLVRLNPCPEPNCDGELDEDGHCEGDHE